jgi:hypothetical protein
MRAFDRDLIRGEHYGQRSGVPHSTAEDMAAPTNAALETAAAAIEGKTDIGLHRPPRLLWHIR